MIDLISIHIPRTAGTSFYQILKQVYGGSLSVSLRRRDLKTQINENVDLASVLSPEIKVIHGHLYYHEAKEMHLKNNSKVICWLREPTSRVVSNYRFFMHGLQNPDKNKTVYQLNKHRINETLLEFAHREENRNRMSKFLKGIDLENLFFFGILESFERDINLLSKLLNWSNFEIPHLNNVVLKKEGNVIIDNETVQILENLNADDQALYHKALKLKGSKRR